MKLKNKKRSAFTLVELLVVIAILAVLATVSIVGYTSFINKANKSADEQAVTQMNVLLEALDVENEPQDIQALFEYLAESGLDADDYKPLTKNTYFYWDQTLNRILYVDANNNVMYPENYTSATPDNNWQSLSGTIPGGTDTVTITDGSATVTSGAQFVNVNEQLVSGSAAISTITLSGTVDCMGASVTSGKATSAVTIGGAENSDSSSVVLKNAISDDFYETKTTKDHASGKNYYTSLLFAEITSTVTVQNMTFENITVGSYEAGNNGIIAGIVSGNGKLIVKNVTFKNCTVYGMNKVGIIAGYVQGGSIEISNVTFENCKVYSSEGEAALAVGVVGAYSEKTDQYSSNLKKIAVSGLTLSGTNSVSVVADEYHDLLTASNGDKYITKVDSYNAAKIAKAEGNEYHDKTDSYWKVCVANENALVWIVDSDIYDVVSGLTFTSAVSASSSISACWARQRKAITDVTQFTTTSSTEG